MRREDLNTHTSPVVVYVDVFLFIFLGVHLSKSREMDAGFFFFKEYTLYKGVQVCAPQAA